MMELHAIEQSRCQGFWGGTTGCAQCAVFHSASQRRGPASQDARLALKFLRGLL